MEESQTPTPVSVQPETLQSKKTHGIALSVTICLLIGLCLAVGVYLWQHQKVTNLNTELTSKNAKISSLNDQVKDLKVVTLSSDQKVIAAVKAYCNAIVDSATKKPLVLTMGTTQGKQVLYSSDQKFAYVNASCGSQSGFTEGSGAAYYLKNVNGAWIFLYRGQEPSPQYTSQFDIPANTEFK